MLTTIQIAGLQTYGYHGLFEKERNLGQRFVFDVEATLRSTPTHRDASLAASVRYDALVGATASLAAAAKYRTLEALAEAVTTGLLERFALIDSVVVGISKLNPPIPHTIGKVGITIHLTRAELAVGAKPLDLVQAS